MIEIYIIGLGVIAFILGTQIARIDTLKKRIEKVEINLLKGPDQ